MLELNRMSLIGRGLESLIPRKSGSSQNPSQNFSDSFQSKEVSASLERRASESERTRYAPIEHHRIFNESQTGERRPSERDKSFPRNKPSVAESVFQIETEKIKPNPFQPRKIFDQAGVEELAASIREFGLIQPLIVSKNVKETDYGTAVEYQLIAGERRLMAAKILGLERVPAIVKKVDGHRAKLEMALIENIQRRDLNPLEEAKAYARLQDEFGLVQREIAVRVGKSREVVANTLRLLNLPFNIQEALGRGEINESQARTLLTIQNVEEQNQVFKNLLQDKLSVRELRTKMQRPAASDPESRFWENRLEEKLGASVKVKKNQGHGRMIVQFHSEEEWQGILNKILGEND